MRYLITLTLITLLTGCVTSAKFDARKEAMDGNMKVMVDAVNNHAKDINALRKQGMVNERNAAIINCYLNSVDGYIQSGNPEAFTKLETCIKNVDMQIKETTNEQSKGTGDTERPSDGQAAR